MADDRPYHALTAIPDIEQKILDGLSAGRSLKSIADENHVSDVAILHRVQDHPGYRIAQSVGLELRMDMREEQLEMAADNVSVTRADRLLGHARWLAERCAPDRFGQRNQVTIDIGAGLAQALEDARDRTRQIVAAQLPQCTIEHNPGEGSQPIDSTSD